MRTTPVNSSLRVDFDNELAMRLKICPRRYFQHCVPGGYFLSYWGNLWSKGWRIQMKQ